MTELVDIVMESITWEMLINALFSVGRNQNCSEYMFGHSHLSGKV
jgi:hypothetical protein